MQMWWVLQKILTSDKVWYSRIGFKYFISDEKDDEKANIITDNSFKNEWIS